MQNETHQVVDSQCSEPAFIMKPPLDKSDHDAIIFHQVDGEGDSCCEQAEQDLVEDCVCLHASAEGWFSGCWRPSKIDSV